MSTDIQQTQIENISPSLENKGNFLSQIKSNPEFIQEQKDKIISFYNSLSASDKEKFELEIIENQELLSVEFENIFAGISKKYWTVKVEQKIKQEESGSKQDKQENMGIISVEWWKQERIETKKVKDKIVDDTLILKAKAKIDAFYGLFWGKDWLEQKLQESWVDVQGLKNKAAASIKKDNPNLDENSEEFKSKVEISFIANNRKKIVSVTPEDKKAQLDALYRDIVESADNLKVRLFWNNENDKGPAFWPFKDRDNIIIGDRQEVAISIPDWVDISRRWWIISYEEKKDWYTVEINIDEKPPERYIKWEWVNIKVNNKDVKYESRYEFMVKRKKLEREISWIKDYLVNNKNKVESIKYSNKELKEDFNTRLENFKKWVYLERNEKWGLVPINLPAPQNREVAEQWLKEDYEKIMKDRQILRVYEEQEKLLKEQENKLIELKKVEQESIFKFKKSIAERDEIARSNIKYLAKTHLNVFWENNIDRIIELINKYRAINWNAWAREVDIDEWFRESDKSIMINSMTKLLRVKYFKNIDEPIDYIGWKLVDNNFVIDKLMSSWVIAKDRTTVDFNKVEELLKTGNTSKQEKSEK